MIKHFDFPKDSIPINDCSGLIPTWVHQLSDLNRVEAENILNAQKKYLFHSVSEPKSWFQISQLKVIHKDMFGQVWEWAGIYRKSVTSIGVNPNLIPMKLLEFCYEVISWFQEPTELTFLEMAAKVHHRLVYIHPFENGNGRFSRLVADRFLLALRCPYPIWPSSLNKEGVVRKEYIFTLKAADKGDYTHLIHFMKKLGAKNPDLSELFRNKFYRPYIKGKRGITLLNALLKCNGNPNDQTPNGHRILQLAIKTNLEEIVKILVNFGAEINTKDRSGLTPFQAAIMQENKSLAEFLVSKGAKRQVPPGIGYVKFYKLYGK